jgi:hypothetical protein
VNLRSSVVAVRLNAALRGGPALRRSRGSALGAGDDELGLAFGTGFFAARSGCFAR